ncbi:hypothetical protein [Streptomyces nitrosporeus]|uniref:hypothetical protein n=1 Tax=Streptomyces nitrosporeus TaxID=28894 RepID=UPI00332BF860
MTTTHGAVGLNAPTARFFTNEGHSVTVTWGGGRAAVHVWQTQPRIDFRHGMKWSGDPHAVVPNELLGEVLKHAQETGREEAAEHLTMFDLRNQFEPLDWFAPVALTSRSRAEYGLLEAAR